MFEGSGLAKKYRIKKCECPNGKMTRFVEPCMLFFLSQGDSHGYELMAKLDDFGFPKAKPDPAMVYRTLRYLEKEGFVTSKWDTKGTGPAKRNYGLTRKGVGLLHLWAESIAMRKQVLEKFLEQYVHCFKKQ
jgi:PadR family transcriptional regulator, regulatory protein PadR